PPPPPRDCEDEIDAGSNNNLTDEEESGCGAGFAIADPQLGPLQDNGGPTQTRLPALASPAIDAGSNADCPGTDQRGESRPQNGTCDIGAVERSPFELEEAAGIGGPGVAVTTDSEADGATPLDVVETTVDHPGGGAISISEGPGQAGFGLLGQTVQLDVSNETATLFFVTFRLDGSIVPPGQSAATIEVTKDGVPVPDCGTTYPCVQNREMHGDDAVLTIVTSQASEWAFAPGAATPPLDISFLGGSDLPGEPRELAVDSTTNRAYAAVGFPHTVSVREGTLPVADIPASSGDFSTGPIHIAADELHNRAYVAHTGSNFARAIDGAALVDLGTFPTGAYPEGIVVDSSGQPGTDRLYIANTNSGTVRVYDTGVPVPDALQDIPIPGAGAGITNLYLALIAQTSRLYVTAPGLNRIFVINTVTRGIIGEFPLTGTPSSIVADSGADKLYVKRDGSQDIAAIDATSGALLGTTPLSGAPIDLDVNPALDRLYVTTHSGPDADGLIVVDTNTYEVLGVRRDLGGATQLHTVAVDRDGGEIYVSVRQPSPQLLYLDDDSTPPPPPPPSTGQIHASLTNDYVLLFGYAPNTSVPVQIGSYSDTVTTDGDGHANIQRETHGQDLVPGMDIVAGSKTLTLEPITFDELNPLDETATGTAPSGREVQVFVHQGETQVAQANVEADDDGGWLAAFADIDFGMNGSADLVDGDGDRSRADIDLQEPVIHASHTSDFVFLGGWVPGSTVHVSSNVFETSVVVDDFGNASFNPEADIQIGTWMDAFDDGFRSKSLTVEAITITDVDLAANTVSGTAPPVAGREVQLFVNQGGTEVAQGTATTNEDGSWTATDLGDLTFGMHISADLVDPDQDRSRADLHLQRPEIHASHTSDFVFLGGWAANSTVHLSIDGVVTDVTIDGNGNAHLNRDVHGQDIQVASLINAFDDAFRVKDLQVESITITDIDLDLNTVSGFGPGPFREVQVFANDQFGNTAQASTVTNADSFWTVTLPTDLTFGGHVNADVVDGDGDRSRADVNLQQPWIQASYTSDWINLNGWEPNSTVHLTIDGYALDVTVGPFGWANVPPWMHGRDVVVGSVINAHDDGFREKDLIVEAITFQLDPDTDTASGTAPANRQVSVQVHSQSGPPLFEDTTTSDGDGNWSLSLAPFDFVSGGASAGVHDGDGDVSQADVFVQPPQIHASLTGDSFWLGNWDPGQVMVTVNGTANPPVTIDIGADGTGFGNAGVDLQPGDVIVATQNPTKTLTLVNLTVAADPDTETVSGMAPAGEQVWVNVNQGETFRSLAVTANGDGFYEVTFTDFDIRSGTHIQVNHFDEDQDATTVQLTLAPDTTIDSGPAPGSTSTTDGDTFTFSSPGTPGAQFECRLDSGPWQQCASPKTVYVADGAHTFAVRAKQGFVTDPTPAERSWTAEVPAPAEGTLRVDMGGGVNLDPAGAPALDNSAQVLRATCAPLLGYPDENGSMQLVPEAATALPTVSLDHRTYTFTIRSGWAFAGGSPLTAQSYADAITRGISTAVNPADFAAYSLIQGAAAYRSGESATVTGVSAVDDQTLQITLTQAHYDFLHLVATRWYCPVPPGTPHTPLPYVIGSGPYTIDSFSSSEVVLVRNAFYGGSRSADFDSIEINVGVEQAQATARALAGDSDYAVSSGNLQPDTDSLFDSYGPGADPQRFFVNPGSFQQNLFFNTTRPGLNDVRIRRAINIALDRLAIRTALAGGQVHGGTPTDQFLHGAHPGFQNVGIYDFAGDLLTAAALVEDAGYTLDSPLTINLRTTSGNAPRAAAAALIRDTLAQIGIDVEIQFFNAGQLFGTLLPSHDFDMTLFAWVGGGQTGAFVKTVFGTGGANNFSAFSDGDVDGQIAAALTGVPPDGDAAWAALDETLSRDYAPGAGLMTGNDRDLFSERVACQAHNPAYGMSLAALCPAATTYVVTNTNDSGAGSLRQALLDSNADEGPGNIVFDIPGTGVQTILPLSPLPLITDEVRIDGFTQPGAQPHTPTEGSTGLENAVLLIQINNTNVPSSPVLEITGADSVVRGLVLNRGIYGLALAGAAATGNVVRDNFIGTNPAGTEARTNGIYGVIARDGASGNTIRDNLISGNVGSQGDNGNGVGLALGAHDNTVTGNWIGTQKNGIDTLPNSTGVIVLSGAHDNFVGGASFPSNFIVGNSGEGVRVQQTGTDDNTIRNNFIGVTWLLSEEDRRDVGNGGPGVQVIEAGGTQIVGNTIANNGGPGVSVLFDATGTTIQSRIRNSGGLGIDLGGDGVTPNDPLDADGSPNHLQNFPQLTSAEQAAAGDPVSLAGILESAPGQVYTIQLFQSPLCDPSGFGEGQTIRGPLSVTTDGTGMATFTHSYTPNAGEDPTGQFVTATATDAAGNTSEFSACEPVLAPGGAAQVLALTADQASAGVGAASVPLSSVPPALFPIFAGAPQAAPIPNSAVGAAPIPNSPIPNSPIPNSPIPNSPIPNSPIPNSGLGGVPDSVLDKILLSSLPGVDWHFILGTAAPLQTLSLLDVRENPTWWANLSSRTVGQLGLEQTVFRSARFLSFFFGAITLDRIPPYTQAAWCAQLASCAGVDVTETTILGVDLAGYMPDFSALGNVTIGQIHDGDLASSPIPNSPIPNSPIPNSAILQTTLSSVVIGSLPIPNSVVDCSKLGADCLTKTLGDAARAGAILSTATWANVLAVLGDREMAEFVTAYIGLANLPWESWPIDGFQSFAGTGESIDYHVDASIVCPAAATTTVNVLLGHGFLVTPGSSRLRIGATGLPQPIANPATSPTTGATWTLGSLSCPFGARFLPVRIDFDGLPGFRLGTLRSSVNLTGGSFTKSATGQAPVTVVQNGEIDDDPAAAPLMAKDTLIVGSIPAGDRLDARRFALEGLAPGTVVQVYLRPPAGTDLDLFLSKPAQQTLLSSPIPNSPIPNSPIPNSPLEDPGTSVNTRSSNLPPEGLADAPIPNSEISSSSISRSDEVEVARVVVNQGDTGPLKIVVAGYNGAYSADPYTLRVKVIAPPVLPGCDPRAFSFTGTTGTLPVGVPSGTKALFLINRSSLEKTYGAAAVGTLRTKLAEVAGRPEVLGQVVEIDGDAGVRAAKTAWDADPCSIQKANDYVKEINELLAGYRAALAGLESITIVGSDEQIAMARVPDLVADTNESTAAPDLAFTTVGGTKSNALYAALATGHVLTDAAYGASTKIAFLGRELYLEEDAVGRLVETPAEITAVLQQYVDSQGLLDLQSAFTTGYDFMQDGAQEIDDAFGDVVGAANADSAISNLWGPSTLSGRLSGAVAGPDLFAPNAHMNHYQLLPATSALSDLLSTALLPPASGPPQFPGAVILTIGCHAGLNVSNTLPAGGTPGALRDWAQGFLQNRTAVYVANTGYGYGHYEAVALSERLFALLAQNLAGSATLGEAWVDAKQEYFATMGAYDVYDEKALIEATFYGLPFWRLDSGTVASLASDGGSAASAPSLALDPLGSGLQVASHSTTPVLTRNDVPGRGSYWTPPDGDVEFHHRRSLQPRLTFPFETAGPLSAHGVRLRALSTGDVTGVDPLYGNATIANSDREPEPNIVDTFWPASPISLHRLPGGDARVVFVAGQSRPDDVQRLFTHAAFDVLYSSSSDRTPPEIVGAGAVFGASATFWVQTRGGAVRGFVLYTTGASAWTFLQLQPVAGTPGLFSATAPGVSGSDVEFAAGVEDGAGNVGYIFNKGALLTPVQPQQAEVTISITSPANGSAIPLGATVIAAYGCASPAGISSCTGPVPVGGTVDTTTPGVRTFTVHGTDLAGNTATRTSSYRVSPGPRSDKQEVLAAVEALLASATRPQDASKLNHAAASLRQALEPGLWIGGSRLAAKDGGKVFDLEKQAVDQLQAIQHDKKAAIPAATLQPLIETLVAAGRVLAETAIADALATPNADPKKVQQAQEHLADASALTADGRYGAAIERYKQAWKKAQDAVKKA
ncbi:MAG: ABC transporter substrate-binding protein, partial [Gaiellaceae bacterium]